MPVHPDFLPDIFPHARQKSLRLSLAGDLRVDKYRQAVILLSTMHDKLLYDSFLPQVSCHLYLRLH